MRTDINKLISEPEINGALEKLVGKKRVSILVVYQNDGKGGTQERYILVPKGAQGYGDRNSKLGKFNATSVKKNSILFDEKNVDLIVEEDKNGKFSVKPKAKHK